MEFVVETAAVVMLAMRVATAAKMKVTVLLLVVLAMQKGQLRAPGLVLMPVVTQVAEPLVAGMKVALVLVSVATGTVFVAVAAAVTIVVGTEAVLVVI